MMKMNVYQLLLCFAILIGGLSLHTSAQSVRGNNNVVKQTREVSGFNGVVVSGAYHLFLTQGSDESVIVEADENLLQYINTDVKGGTLKIYTKEKVKIRNANAMNVYVQLRNFDHLYASGASTTKAQSDLSGENIELRSSGSSDINLQTLETNRLNSRVSGASNISLEGSSTYLELRVSGSGDFQGSNFSADEVDVSVSGSGDADVRATGSISASASGSGDITVFGNPQKEKISTSGSGDIRFK